MPMMTMDLHSKGGRKTSFKLTGHMDNPWAMTEEAVEKRAEILTQQLFDSFTKELTGGVEEKMRTPYSSQGRRYFGHAIQGDAVIKYQALTTTDLVMKLESFKIVEKVYVLSEDEDDSTLTIMIKIKIPSLFHPDDIESENGFITQLLMRAKVDNYRNLKVSFQYTEVFKNE